MSQTMRPFPMCQDGPAQAATTLHASLLAHSQVLDLARHGVDGPFNLA